MVKMAQIYAFPVRQKFPKHIEERIQGIAKEYLEVLYATFILLGEDGTDQMGYEEMIDLAMDTFVEGLEKAVEELDEP
jgi:hypothetical protein